MCEHDDRFHVLKELIKADPWKTVSYLWEPMLFVVDGVTYSVYTVDEIKNWDEASKAYFNDPAKAELVGCVTGYVVYRSLN
jgi:hypothetical protein